MAKVSISLPDELLELLHSCKPSYQPLSQFVCSLIYEGMEARQEKNLIANRRREIAAKALLEESDDQKND